MPPKKRRPGDLGPLSEPPCGPEQAAHFARGVELFHKGAYWDAHEAWEAAWRLMGDGPEDDAEIVLRGLIQLAAALHAHARGRPGGARRNLDKARAKLALFPGTFWGLDVPALFQFARSIR